MLKSLGIIWAVNFLVNFVVIQEINRMHLEANLPIAPLSKQLLTSFLVPNLYIIVIGLIVAALKYGLDSLFEETKEKSWL